MVRPLPWITTRISWLAGIATLLLAATAPAAGPPALEPPSADAIAEARAIVERMKRSDRGPYQRLRWYCNDGTVHPPKPYPCAERGGGKQYAQYTTERERLLKLGIGAGTVLAATALEKLWDPERRDLPLRALVVERYLTDVDDGWVLRRARYYRGRVQIEDEEAAGRAILLDVLGHRAWLARNFLLGRELVRALPHSGGSDRTREVRRIAKEVAAAVPSFERLRIKIHNEPGPEDAASVGDWLARSAVAEGLDAAVVAQVRTLVLDLGTLYGRDGRAERMALALAALGSSTFAREAQALLKDASETPRPARLHRLAAFVRGGRDRINGGLAPEAALPVLELGLEAEEEVRQLAFARLTDPKATRAELLMLATVLLEIAYGAGWLDGDEVRSLAEPLLAVASERTGATSAYLEATRGLERAGGWAMGAVRYTFAEALARYGSVEPKAEGLVDDLLRGSVMLPLAALASRLARDAEWMSGLSHSVFERPAGGLSGLNPGAVVGRLHVVSEDELRRGTAFAPDAILVLPRTVAELTPVAGIVTLAEGNILSHVQMLARNLGIPNATMAPSLGASVIPHDGEEVVFAVGGEGSVVLASAARVAPDVVARLRPKAQSEAGAAIKIDAPVPDLSQGLPLRLAELHRGLSGKVVGPKAANVGELARRFPGRVAAAVAIPFGIFARHVAGGPDAPKAVLDRAFASFRGGTLSRAGLAAAVEQMRQAVAGLELSAETRAALEPMMAVELGPPGTYGVFVRSDTNVEDLPGFTGAGLNETVPNVVGLEAQFAAVPRVWASPFVPRAMAWRERALTRPEEVYPSVLLMKSVPSEKSGVLVTADLVSHGDGLTVAMAWGVGGAVDSEVAESLVLRADGGETRAGAAKAPYQRHLRQAGGVDWIPAPSGAVLTAAEKEALRELAAEARDRLVPACDADGAELPWDIELGFVAGKLQLFQVRPLVERGRERARRAMAALSPGRREAQEVVVLDEPPVSADHMTGTAAR